MGRKGKRRRRDRRRTVAREAGPAARSAGGGPRPAAREPARDVPASREEPAAHVEPEPGLPAERPAGGLLRRREPAASPYPPLGESLSRGAIPIGRSPAILVAAFVSLLALWGIYTALGAEPPPRVLAALFALPPVSLFFDAILVSTAVEGAALSLAFVVVVVAARAVMLAAIGLLAAQAVGRTGPIEREARALLRVTGSLFAILAAELGLVLAVPLFLQGFLGPQFGVVLAWILGLYFLGMVPVVVVVERAPAADGFRRALRAARLPGFRHLSLVMLYFVFLLWVTTIAPGGAVPPATPSLVAWAISLVATFVHVAVLGALVYRWLAVRDQVPSGPLPRRRR